NSVSATAPRRTLVAAISVVFSSPLLMGSAGARMPANHIGTVPLLYFVSPGCQNHIGTLAHSAMPFASPAKTAVQRITPYAATTGLFLCTPATQCALQRIARR